MENYQEIYEKIGTYVKKLTADTEQIDEVTQEVFLKIHQSLGTLRNRDKLSSWLQRIAYTTIVDHHRKQKKAVTHSDIDLMSFPSAASERNPGNEALMECIKALIKLLPDEQKDLLEAVEIQGMSQVQYARDHGLPLSTVKSRIQRAKQKIRDRVNNSCVLTNDKYGNVIDYVLPKEAEEKMSLL